MTRYPPNSILICILIITFLCPVPASCDVFKLKDGTVVDGRIINETDVLYVVKVKTGGTSTFPKSWIKELKKETIPDEQLYTLQDTYNEKLSKIDQKDAGAHIDLAEWCVKNGTPDNGLLQLAQDHFVKAKEIDPRIDDRASRELRKSQDKQLGRYYRIAEIELENEDYIKAEQSALSIVNSGIESDYVRKSKDILTKIWGSSKAAQIMFLKDELPETVYSKDEISAVLSHLPEQDLKEAYINKCLMKAKDYEERAKEAPKDKKAGYYIAAITCYDALSDVDKAEAKGIAVSKSKEMMRGFFGAGPVPFSESRRALITNYLIALDDYVFSEEVLKGFSKLGDEYYKKARKLKQPEKGEKAKIAYYSYFIVNEISIDVKIKQIAFENMVECQRLERARK